MTPDESPIPDDDALAGATRRALGRLSDDGVSVAPWEDVHARGRRTQRVRAAVAIAAALLLVVAGAATVNAVQGKGDHVDVAGVDPGGTTTTSTSAPPSTTTTTTTTTPSTPVVGPPATTPGAPPASSSPDLTGTLRLDGVALVADQSAPYTITLRNQTDHVVRPPSSPNARIGVWVQGDAVACTPADATDFSLEPRAEHTYTAAFTPTAEMIGLATIYVAYLYAASDGAGGCSAGAIQGVEPVTVFVLPPGYVAGQPLDPSIGRWTATVTADATQVSVGDSVTLHATLQNLGTQDELTRGYGSLAFYCQGPLPDGQYGRWGQFVDAATVHPGESAEFMATFQPDAGFVDTANCSIGLAFHDDPNITTAKAGITSNGVDIGVLPADSTTSTTGP